MQDARPERRRLRVLCLHGFRQSASQFKVRRLPAARPVPPEPEYRLPPAHAAALQGRTAALRKRLRHLADFVFADAPHCLPLLARPPASTDSSSRVPPAAAQEQGQRQRQQELGQQEQQRAPRCGWLLLPEQHAALAQRQRCSSGQLELQALQEQLLALGDQQQHSCQTAGWPESWAALRQVLESEGPFDGVLGFSQGAAVAAVLCALLQEGAGGGGLQLAGSTAADSSGSPDQLQPLRFAILCSGYASPVPEHRELLGRCRQAGGIRLASLHIFGTGALPARWGGAAVRPSVQHIGASYARVGCGSIAAGARCGWGRGQGGTNIGHKRHIAPLLQAPTTARSARRRAGGWRHALRPARLPC